MDTIIQQVKEWWKAWEDLAWSHKVAWTVGILVCLGSAGVFWWMSQPDYRVLYAGLSAEEAGAITGKLQTKGIPYKLTAGGSTVLVPVDQAMQAFVDLALEGVPGSSKVGKGFDGLFDQPMLGATPFHQHVNYLRAQQAELARTIMQIDPIVFARVHIVRPEPSPFVRDQKATTASVLVKLRPGASMHRNTVAGIGAMVAGSVEGLTKDNVTIMDTSGKRLSDNHDGPTGMAGSFIERRKEVEQYLSSEVERMLTAVLGPGRAIVKVTADLNLKQIHEKKESVHGEARLPRSEQTTTKKGSTGGPAKGGGAVGFPPFGAKVSGAASGTSTNEEIQKVDYFIPIRTEEIHHKYGTIDRLTIAAFVDPSAANSEKTVSVEDIQEIIKTAVGFKSDRDEIKVTEVRMPVVSTETFEREWESHQQTQTILSIVRNSSIGLGVICLAVMAWTLWRKLAATREAATEKTADLATELDRNPAVLAELLSRWMDRTDDAKSIAA